MIIRRYECPKCRARQFKAFERFHGLMFHRCPDCRYVWATRLPHLPLGCNPKACSDNGVGKNKEVFRNGI